MNYDKSDEIIEGYNDGLTGRYEDGGIEGEHSGTIEVREEHLEVRKREVEQGRVRIDKRIEHVPFAEDIDLAMDIVDVQRVPRFEDLDTPPESRYEGDTLIIPVVEEVVVMSRRYRVTEEVHITTRREVRTERVEEDLRREVVSVEAIDTEPDR